MTDWKINIPYRSRADSLAEVGFAARQLDAEERAIVRALVLQAALGDCRTAGDLLDRVGHATVAERRLMLDNAREAAGLETATEIDARRAAPPISPHTPIAGLDDGGELKGCSNPGCPAVPRDEHGAIALVPDRKWWCAEHRDQAQPGDELPDQDGVATLGPNFELIPSPREQRRIQAEDDRRREFHEREAEVRRAEAAERRKLQEAAERRFVSELPPGFGP